MPQGMGVRVPPSAPDSKSGARKSFLAPLLFSVRVKSDTRSDGDGPTMQPCVVRGSVFRSRAVRQSAIAVAAPEPIDDLNWRQKSVKVRTDDVWRFR